MNPIIRRELLEQLRTRKMLGLQVGLATAAMLLVLVRWPTDAVADLSGARALQVLQIIGYGLLACIVLLVPAFPAVSIVREKIKGTLPLLLNSPLSPLSIYVGKLGGVLGYTAILLIMTLPAAAASYALGGTGTQNGITMLYALLALTALQLSTVGLLVSCYSQSIDGALRVVYAIALAICILPLALEALLRAGSDPSELSTTVRSLSPIPAMMEIMGHASVGTRGLLAGTDAFGRYAIWAILSSIACAMATIFRLKQYLLDRARPAGIMTQDRSAGRRAVRRLMFLVDPQRRTGCQSLWINPVLMKELRSRRFGRSHWMLRLIAVCAILSLTITYVAASGALGWGIDYIGGLLVLLQVALLILFAPNLAAGLISSERESGSWQLLRMTPLSVGTILRGKLLSVAWPVLLLLCATLPGYIVMVTIQPNAIHQVYRVVACLGLMTVFVVLASATASTFFRSTAVATTVAYGALLSICIAPLFIWFGRDAPFGHRTVETVLSLSPVAAALQASGMAGFTQYELLTANGWIIGVGCIVLVLILGLQTWRLYRPE